MSPRFMGGPFDGLGFPRVSGDEPLTARSLLTHDPFSPRERG